MADATSAERSTGTVKWFSAQKGFGFIAPDDGGDDLFVHQTSILSQGFRTLSDNQPVEFAVDFGEDGRAKAVDVSPIPRSRRPSRGDRGGGRGGSFGGRGRGGGGGGYRRVDYGGAAAGGGGGGGGACYTCGRMGHLSRDCYQSSGSTRYSGSRGAGGGEGGGNRRYGGGGSFGGGGGGGGGECFNCGEEGHFARDCPNK